MFWMSHMPCEHDFTLHTNGEMSSLESLPTWLCNAQKSSTGMDRKTVETVLKMGNDIKCSNGWLQQLKERG
jgi:hypothetical protein